MDLPPALTDRVAAVLSIGFARLAARRGGEAVHHHGVVLTGRIATRRHCGPLGVPLLDRPGPYDVLGRLSWGLGRAERLPDVAGLGLRVLDADGKGGVQDLLIDSCLPAPHDRVLVLRRDLAGWFGTPLRLRLGQPHGRKVQVAAHLLPVTPGPLTLDRARAGAEVDLVLVVHDRDELLATGHGRLVARSSPAPGAVRFDVDASAGGLADSGFWQAMRHRTYAASRAGDPRT
jgi:hypothetical protein